MPPPDLSIIIVNWNTGELLEACLDSLSARPAPGLVFETIVVDNASSDGSLVRLRSRYSLVRVIESERNGGFAVGNNLGLQASRGRYGMLLNSDTIVLPGALETLVAFLDAHPAVGACGPRLLRPDGSVQPFVFGADPTPGYLLQRGLKRLLLRKSLHDWETATTQPVDWVAGTCLVARRAAWERAGLLDENFFMYFEDNDWCLRMRRQGWNIYYIAEAAITHLGGQSAARNPEASAAYYRSLRYFYRKHYNALARLWLELFLPLYRRLAQT
jgi:hypothetical protein